MAKQREHVPIIAAVQTPLGFFTLVVLVFEGALVGLATALDGDNRWFLVRAIPVSLIALAAVVAWIAWFRPEALWGKRYSALETEVAQALGVEVFDALDGYMSNLEPVARSEAYDVLRGAVMSSRYGTKSETKEFCAALVDTIIRRAAIRQRYAQGVLRVPQG